MPYIGNTVQTQGFTPAIDYFSGNGVTVTFTLTRPVVSVAQMIVVIDNVPQNPSSAYTVSGSSITFTSAPLSGTNNIWVEYTSLITTYAAISQDPSVIGDITASGGYLSTGDFGNSYIDGIVVDYVTGNGRITVGPADGLTIYNGGTSARTAMGTFDANGNFTNNATGYTGIAVGTTAQRPVSPAAGMTRMNTTTGYPEWYDASSSSWVQFNNKVPYAASYLVIAGGGGGGRGASSGAATNGGAGGAGGYLTNTAYLTTGTTYTITVGSGGAGGGVNTGGTSGNNSVFGSIATSIGGGGGASGSAQNLSGSSGGSGGGGSGGGAGGSGTSGQGNAGATGPGGNDSGGGGGAGAAGSGINGGNGLASSITGSSVTRAGGGGGGRYNSTGGTGGTGGGGNGGTNTGAAGNGTANTGSGGGAAGMDASGVTGTAGSGGSGVVIISVPTANYSGTTTGSPTVTTSGSNTIMTFTSSGSYTA